MRKKLVVLDFDGTFTKIEAETEPFTERFFERARARMRMSTRVFDDMVRECHVTIHASPDHHGWEHNGVIVAGLVDHYIVVNAIVTMMFRNSGTFASEHDLVQEIQAYFSEIAPTLTPVFKPDAAGVLEEVAVRYPDTSYIVTNSKEGLAQARLKKLFHGREHLSGLIERVRGSARKYVVDTSCEEINPGTMVIPGLARDIHLRRPLYYGVINHARILHGLRWEEVVVVGDIAELDLMMPFALGATVGLIDHELVPEYERVFLRSHPRGRILSSPTDILSMLDSE